MQPGEIELQRPHPESRQTSRTSVDSRSPSTIEADTVKKQDNKYDVAEDEAGAEAKVEAPNTAVHALQRWNEPRVNMWRICATFVGFIIMGANDAAYGVSSRALIYLLNREDCGLKAKTLIET